jgi:hypothetical protein
LNNEFSTAPSQKSFGQAFSKACAVKARSLVARRNERNFPSAFLFVSFFFAPTACKEKAAND